MKLTRRGITALLVVAAAVVMAWLSGPRSLNAVAAPLLIAVAAGALQVHRAEPPTIDRTRPRRGFPGETRGISLTVDGTGVAEISEQFGSGLSGPTDFEQSLPATVSYELTYEQRGVHEITGTTVSVRDVLGLVETRYELPERTEVIVYPAVHSLTNAETFFGSMGFEEGDRSEFDRLREYVPGDSLRDIHWKSSAKYDDLLVTEFTDPTSDDTVSIAAHAGRNHADEMATAVATVFVALQRAGLQADLTVPSGSIGAGRGQHQQQRALELLARTTSGTVDRDTWEAADVRIEASDRGVTITIGDRDHDLQELAGTRDNPLVAEGAL
ncbi:DUF58 domain-containing protein [Halobacteriales archaeon QS_4_62_28]|nr:MAG: DUF58 domain-containing protein [Halobacteriales archaeon QS_4_62_28]